MGPGCLRYLWVLHCTWLVNSAAHLWGSRPYDPASNPAENALVAIASIGEGWHNWHHKYPFDYAASEYGFLSQFNPTKLIIDICASIGLVSERKRATAMWAREKVELAQKSSDAKIELAHHEDSAFLMNHAVSGPLMPELRLLCPAPLSLINHVQAWGWQSVC